MNMGTLITAHGVEVQVSYERLPCCAMGRWWDFDGVEAYVRDGDGTMRFVVPPGVRGELGAASRLDDPPFRLLPA